MGFRGWDFEFGMWGLGGKFSSNDVQSVLRPFCLSPMSKAAAERKGELLRRTVKRFRGGLVFKAHRLLYHSTLGSGVIKKKGKKEQT